MYILHWEIFREMVDVDGFNRVQSVSTNWTLNTIILWGVGGELTFIYYPLYKDRETSIAPQTKQGNFGKGLLIAKFDWYLNLDVV